MAEGELFPAIEPYRTAFLPVSARHNLYYEEVGNPRGVPIVFLHGGPGSGLFPDYRRFCDPSHYRVVLFDQRGSGRSMRKEGGAVGFDRGKELALGHYLATTSISTAAPSGRAAAWIVVRAG